MSPFINALNEYNAIFKRQRPSTHAEYNIARVLHTIDTSSRRRRYLTTTTTPSIDDYIDFAYSEMSNANRFIR